MGKHDPRALASRLCPEATARHVDDTLEVGQGLGTRSR
jgi:hypothetical protein